MLFPIPDIEQDDWQSLNHVGSNGDITNIAEPVSLAWNGRVFVVYYRNNALRYVFRDSNRRWHPVLSADPFNVKPDYRVASFGNGSFTLFTYKNRLYLAYYNDQDPHYEIQFLYFINEDTGWQADTRLRFDLTQIQQDFNPYWDALYGLGLEYVDNRLYMGFVSGDAPGKSGGGYGRWMWAFGCDSHGNDCNSWHIRYGVSSVYMPDRSHFYSLWNRVVKTGTDTLYESGTSALPLMSIRRFWR